DRMLDAAPFTRVTSGVADDVSCYGRWERVITSRSQMTSRTPVALTPIMTRAMVCKWLSVTPVSKATAMIAEDAMESIKPNLLNKPDAVPIWSAGVCRY